MQENQCFFVYLDGKRNNNLVFFCLNAITQFVVYPDGKRNTTNAFCLLFGPIRMANAIKPKFVLPIQGYSDGKTESNQCFFYDPDGKRDKTNVCFCYPDGKRNKTKGVLLIRMTNANTTQLFCLSGWQT